MGTRPSIRVIALLSIMIVLVAACGSTATEVPTAAETAGDELGDLSGAGELPPGAHVNKKGQVVNAQGEVIGSAEEFGLSSGSSAAGSGSSAGSSGTAAGGSAAPVTGGAGSGVRPAAAPGITDTKMFFGIPYVKNQCEANRALGGGDTCVDSRHATNAMIDWVNDQGGLGGRKVAPVYYGYDATSSKTSDQQTQEACAHWTQDNKVFMIFSAGSIVDECAKKAGVAQLGGGPSFPDTYRKYPHRIDINNLNSIRMGQVTVNGLNNQSYFSDKDPKYGFVTWDDPDYRRTLKEGYLPSLGRVGAELTEVAYLHSPQSVEEIGQTSADVSNAVLRFKAAGIDHVIIQDGSSGACAGACIMLTWMRQSEAQDYRPRYGLNGDDGPPEAAKRAGFVPASQLRNSVTVDWSDWNDQTNRGLPPNTRMKKCKEIMRKRDVDMSNLNQLGAALSACDAFWFLQFAFARMPQVITIDNFVVGVNRIGYDYKSVAAFGNFFSPSRHDGLGAVRDGVFRDSCECYQYPDMPYKV